MFNTFPLTWDKVRTSIYPLKLLSFQNLRSSERQQAPICWFTSEMPTTFAARVKLEPRVENTIHVYHMGGRNLIIWATITISQDVHQQETGVKSQKIQTQESNPGPPMWADRYLNHRAMYTILQQKSAK